MIHVRTTSFVKLSASVLFFAVLSILSFYMSTQSVSASDMMCADGVTRIPPSIASQPALAADFCAQDDRGGIETSVTGVCDTSSRVLGFPNWYEYLPVDQSDCSVGFIRDGDDLNIGATVGAILLALTEILLRIAGIVAVGFVIYGGVLYGTSQGAPDKLQAAQKTIVNGLIGLVVAVLAVAIVNLLTNILIT